METNGPVAGYMKYFGWQQMRPADTKNDIRSMVLKKVLHLSSFIFCPEEVRDVMLLGDGRQIHEIGVEGRCLARYQAGYIQRTLQQCLQAGLRRHDGTNDGGFQSRSSSA